MKRRRKNGLTKKFTLGIILIGFLITAGVAIVGVRFYRDSITKQYNKTAYQIAKTAEGIFTPEELSKYADLTYRYNKKLIGKEEINEVTNSERYQEIKELIENLQESMNANDIYVFNIDVDLLEHFNKQDYEQNNWNPIYYITDSYKIKEDQLSLGDSGPFYEEFITDILESYKSGVHADNYFVSQGTFGYNTAAIYPVVQEGKTIAFVGVEIPMETLQTDTITFIKQVAITAGILAILLLAAGIYILIRTLIKPIQLVASEAKRFVENNTEVSDKLGTIHTNDEVQVLGETLLKLEIDINEYIENLTQVTAEKERIGAELNVATQIQADMLPRLFPYMPDRTEFDLYATMDPAKEVGGDFYDYFMIDENHLAIVIGDVSGKGVPAALFMVISKTLIKNYTMMGLMPDEAFTRANEDLCEGNEAELFTTAWLGVYEISTGILKYADAGHDHPIIMKKGGVFEYVKPVKKKMMLAGMEGVQYLLSESKLEIGDTILLYTDGVPEATNAENELYGQTRLENVIMESKGKMPNELLKMIRDDVDKFVGKAPQFDDITMLALNRQE